MNTDNIIREAAAVGTKLNLWAKHGKLRLYVDDKGIPQHVKVYLDLDGTSEEVLGGQLSVTVWTDPPLPSEEKEDLIHRYTADFEHLFDAYTAAMYVDEDSLSHYSEASQNALKAAIERHNHRKETKE